MMECHQSPIAQTPFVSVVLPTEATSTPDSMQRLPKRPQVVSAAAVILWLSWERRKQLTTISLSQRSYTPFVSATSLLSTNLFSPSTAICEAKRLDSPLNVPTPSRLRRTLAALHIKALPLPRRLVPSDPVFSDSSLERGLRQRERDESSLRELQQKVVKAVNEKRETEYIRALHHQFCEIAYGKGVTPQMREDFLVVSVNKQRHGRDT